MNCQQIQPELSAYVDDELAPAARTEIETHLGGCATCRGRVAELRKLAVGVAILSKSQPAPQFLAAVRRKIGEAETSERVSWGSVLFRPAWMKVPMEVAALAAILTAVLVWVAPPSRNTTVQTPAMNRSQPTPPGRNETRTGVSTTPSSAPAAIKLEPVAKAKNEVVKSGDASREVTVTWTGEMGGRANETTTQPVVEPVAAEQQRMETDASKLPALASSAKPLASVEVRSVTPSPDLGVPTFGLATPVSGVSSDRRSSETIILPAKDAVTALASVETVANSFGGRIESSKQTSRSMQSFLVELPAARVAAFKTRLEAQFVQDSDSISSRPVAVPETAGQAKELAAGETVAARPPNSSPPGNEPQLGFVAGSDARPSASKQALEPDDPLATVSPATTLVEIQVLITGP